jgi:hypothetical protein
MSSRSVSSEIGVGATDELSLRVSVATLVRVLFEHPKDGTTVLALERKATVLENENGQFIQVKSQPFGGAMRLLAPGALRRRIGDFHFDSDESYKEQDFRIFIRPADWKAVEEFSLEYLKQPNESILESDPTRELTEEFDDTLGIRLHRDQLSYQPVGILVEDHPSPTGNIHANGYPTARIYRIFKARILDTSLASALIKNSESCSDHHLRELALQNLRNGGLGKANAILALSYREINDFYVSVPSHARNHPVFFGDHQLDETTAAVLEVVTVPKYRNV